MGWGGVRPGSGRKPGAQNKAPIQRMIAAAVLEQINEVERWLEVLDATRITWVGSGENYQQITVPDYAVRQKALEFLTTQRDGRAYQQINPLQAQRLQAGDDPKLAAVLQNLLPQPGSATVTITEKQMRIGPSTSQDTPLSRQDAPGRTAPSVIQALESHAIEAERETPKHALEADGGTELTHDATVVSSFDPSGRKVGDGHFGAESHTERNQNSEPVLKTKKIVPKRKKPSDVDREKTKALRGWAKGVEQP